MESDCWLMTYNVSNARNCNAATEIMLFFITNGGILNERKPAFVFVHNYNLKNTCNDYYDVFYQQSKMLNAIDSTTIVRE